MTPDQEAKLHLSLNHLNAAVGIITHEMRTGFTGIRADIHDLRSHVARHGRRLKKIEDKAEMKVDPGDITGTHDVRELMHSVDDLQKQAQRRDSMMKFVKRQWVIWAFGLLSIVVAGCGSVGATLVLHYWRK